MTMVKITLTENGPLKVEGSIEVLDASGAAIPTREGKAVYLCRCGASTRKPFCDGTHSKIGFAGAAAAVAAQEGLEEV